MTSPTQDPIIEARSQSLSTSPRLSQPQQPQQLNLATLFGHPHDQADPQPTTPFWHQYPDQHLARSFYYPAYDIYSAHPLYYNYQANMSDGAPLIIGSGSKFGVGNKIRRGPKFGGGPKFGIGAGRRGPKGGNPKRRPRESARVWLEGTEVGEIALGVLTRFSRNAKNAFPRPQAEKEVTKDVKAPASGSAGKAVVDGEKKVSRAPAGNSTGKTEKEGKKAAKAPATASTSKAIAGSSEKASEDWADDEDTDEDLVVEEDGDATSATNSSAKDTPSTDASAPDSSVKPASSKSPTPNPSTNFFPAALSTHPTVPKNFSLHNNSWVQPKLPQLQHVLAWMETNKTTRHGESLMPLIPIALDALSTTALVDIYIAVAAFDLTPFPHPLRRGILKRLTDEPVTLAQLQYFYDVLPEGDTIVSRLVTSVLEHYEAGHYHQQEYNEIYDWVEFPASKGGVDDNGYLKAHFGRVERSRKRKAKEAQRGQLREQGWEKLKSWFEAFAGPIREPLPSIAGATTSITAGSNMAGLTGATTVAPTGGAEAPGETQEERRVRRRNRRRQQHDGAAKAAGAGDVLAAAGVKTAAEPKAVKAAVGGSKAAAGGSK